MPDPINALAKVAYTISQAASTIKEKGKEWGRQISTKFPKGAAETEEKVKNAEKRLSSEPLEIEITEEPYPISASDIPKEQEAEKTRNVASEFFKNLVGRFKAAYRDLEHRDEIKHGLKEILASGKPAEDLSPVQLAELKAYILTASKSELESIIKYLGRYKANDPDQQHNPLANLIFQNILTSVKDETIIKLMKDGSNIATIAENFRSLFAEGKHDEVMEFLNSKHTTSFEIILNALLTSPEKLKMAEFDDFTIRDFAMDQLLAICEGGQLSISRYQNLLMNVPEEHFQTLLEKLWEKNPQSAINTIGIVRTLNNKELSEASSKFLEKLTTDDKQVNDLCDRILETNDPALAVEMMDLQDKTVATKVMNGLLEKLPKNPSDEQAQFFTEIAKRFIDKEVNSAKNMRDIFDDQKMGYRYLAALQYKLNQENYGGLPTSLASEIPNFKFVEGKSKELKEGAVEEPRISIRDPLLFAKTFTVLMNQVGDYTSISGPPNTLKGVYQHLQAEIDKKFPSPDGENGKNAILGLFMNKFAKAVLLRPHDLDRNIKYKTEDEINNSIEFARVMSNFVSKEEFPEDSYLAFMNNHLKTLGPIRQKLVNGLTS